MERDDMEADHTLEHKIRSFRRLAERDPELARVTLFRLLDTVNGLSKSVSRDFALLVILPIGFELLNRRLLNEFSAMGVKAASLGFLRYLIPVGFGFVMFRFFSIVRDRLLIWRVYRGLCERAYPELAATRLEIFVAPFTGMAGSMHIPLDFVDRRAALTHDLVTIAEVVLGLIVLPMTFVVYATTQLFRQGEPPYVAAIIVGTSTAGLIAAGYWVYFSLAASTSPDFDET